MTEIAYYLSRIRALPERQKKRWAQSSRNNSLHRKVRHIILKQWLDEVANPT